MLYCRDCGAEVNTKDKYCPSCGRFLLEAVGMPDEMVSPEVLWTTKCPVCKIGSLHSVKERGFFGEIDNTPHFRCDNCDAVFMADHHDYKLTGCGDKSLEVWRRYHKKTLSTEEWKRVTYG